MLSMIIYTVKHWTCQSKLTVNSECHGSLEGINLDLILLLLHHVIIGG